MWPEIEKAIKEKRHELKLLPDNVNKDLTVDESLLLCQELNLLQISETQIVAIPNLSTLSNLQNLLLFRNKIVQFPSSIPQLAKLKVLDLSYNSLEAVPEQINELTQLATLNLSYNSIESLPVLKLQKLLVLNLSGNRLTAIPELVNEPYHLSDLILAENAIEAIPEYLTHISTTLKVLNLEKNAIKELPKLLATLPKLKDLLLKGNPIADKRLLKLINQCGTKQVVDYVKQHGVASGGGGGGSAGGKGKGGKGGAAAAKKEANEKAAETVEATPEGPQVLVGKFDDEKSLRITSTDLVRQLRPHLVCCLWKNVAFDAASFRAFIQLQTKLHETVCQKRELCTIATHDFDKIACGEGQSITYTAAAGDKIPIVPLGRKNTLTAQKFYEELRGEAEALRKEKKRNTYSGIHKYLHLLDKSENFAFFRDDAGTTISLPPLTNSDNTACSVDTKNVLIEITSSSSLPGCKQAFDALVTELIGKRVGFAAESNTLHLEQVKVVDEEGNLRNVYPSKVDLQLEGVHIQRE